MTSFDLEANLEPARLASLEHGDACYERVGGYKGTTWRKMRFVRVNAGRAECLPWDSQTGKRVTIGSDCVFVDRTAGKGMYRKAAAASGAATLTAQPFKAALAVAAAEEPRPQPKASAMATDPDYEAWLAMGQSMVDAAAKQERDAHEERAQAAASVEAVDAAHRATIEALEAQLVEARQEHQKERAFASRRVEMADAKIKTVEEKRKRVQGIIGQAK